jgi:hypothetical protein
VTLLTSRVPEAQAVVTDNLDDNEPLLHLIVADLRRLAVQ